MATINKEFLDLNGLTAYDTAIKVYLDSLLPTFTYDNGVLVITTTTISNNNNGSDPSNGGSNP